MNITEIADKINKPRAFVLGDPVIHKLTKLCGWVEAVERIGTADYQTLVVRLVNGNYIRGARSTEFGLESSLKGGVPNGDPIYAAGYLPPDLAEVVHEKIVGTISDRSILDEIC